MTNKNDIWIGKKGYRYWYYRFRDSQYYSLVITGIIAVVSVVLLFMFVIPEVTNWFSIQQEIDATQQQITTLQQNITFINGMNKTDLDSQLQTASDAVPSEKDFGPVLQAIAYASSYANVSLNNYSFQIGTVKSTSLLPGASLQSKDTTPIELVLVVSGNFDNLIKFIKAIENGLPLASITKIDGSGGNLSITIEFYQKPFPPIAFSPDTQLTPLSIKDMKLLQQLATWDHTSSSVIPTQKQSTGLNKTTHVYTVISSGSANLVPLF